MVDVSTNTIFTQTSKKGLTLTKIDIIDVYAKFALEWQPLVGVNTLICAPNTTKP